MDLAWIEDLNAAVDRLADSPEVSVVVVQGQAARSAPGSIWTCWRHTACRPGFYEGQERAFRKLELLDAITVAAIHGYCLGGGVQLAIACDVRVCSADATLGLPAVNEGLFPGLAPFRLPHLVGKGAAARLIFSGESIDADEALRIGLVDYVLPVEQFEAGLERILQSYLAAPRAAVVGSKRLMRHAFSGTHEEAYETVLAPAASVSRLGGCRRRARGPATPPSQALKGLRRPRSVAPARSSTAHAARA